MGMYDELICKMSLPENPPSFVTPDYRFQTKDFDCTLSTVIINESGELEGFSDFTGIIEFYSSNWSAVAYGLEFTANGEDFESVEYLATVVDGKVVIIEELSKEKRPALSSKIFHEAEEKFNKRPAIDLTEPEIGDKLYLKYYVGEGKEVTLGLKTERNWAVYDRDGIVDTVHPGDFGRILFHSKEDAKKLRASEKSTRRHIEKYLKNLLKEKK